MSQQPTAIHPGPQPAIPEAHAEAPDPRCTEYAACHARCARAVHADGEHWHCELNSEDRPGDALL